MMTNLLTDDLEATCDLFINLMGFVVEFESDWFISMSNEEGHRVGAMLRKGEFVPAAHQKKAQGIIITLVVEDVEPYFKKAKKLKFDIVEKPTDLPYGQRRLLLRDSSGALLDISAPTAPLDKRYS